MKFAKLVHNPDAGDGHFGKKELIAMIQAAGFGCSYSSTKKEGWEKIGSMDADFIILAGGDGTVRRVAASLLNRKVLDRKLPIALLPFGTANNIAKTLGIIHESPEKIVSSWNEKHLKKFDIGRIYGLKQHKFFLESFGVGIFPDLIHEMGGIDPEEVDTAEKSLGKALEVLHNLIMEAEAKFCKIKIDDVEHKGNYLLVEIMNTTTIGPKLNLAPLADPGDGRFDVVLIAEKQREQFADYVEKKLQGIELVPFFELLRARKLDIFWEGTKVHIDDETVRLKKGTTVKIELLHGLLEFFVTDQINGSPELKGKV
jgi:diacylglycerol kinase (ATP)